MAVAAVHQFSPALLPGDAVGAHMLQVRRAVRDVGLESEIFVENLDPQMEGEARPYSAFPKRPGDSVLVYHLAIGSVVADFVHARPEPLVVNYHNATPARYFRDWDVKVTNALTWARLQLRFLAGRSALGIGDSAFNQAEMVEQGYHPTAVVPILFDTSALAGRADPVILERLQRAKQGGGADLLFVGRLAPNKAQHDLVKALAAYRAVYDPAARLHLVGRPASETYAHGLARFVADAGLEGSVELAQYGVSHPALIAHYRAADVLVSASEHEGFCVPMLEAMHHRVPIVAFAAAAVPDTVGRAGLLLEDKSPLAMAAAIHRVLSDVPLREQLLAAGTARLDDFSLERSRTALLEALAPLTGRPARLAGEPTWSGARP